METGLLAVAVVTLGLSGAAQAQHCNPTRPSNRVWVPERYDFRERQIVIPAEHKTVRREVWVEPVYEWVTRRVWVENHRPASNRFRFSVREFSFGWNGGGGRSRDGYFRTVRERVLICDGHYETFEQVVCVRPERVETIRERVLVEPGHWEVVFARR